mmetsp:Transcript_110279/g.154758  ORF Transcript_110279/g.154758 Transcript_110279/m.154758 type:complete len:282 (+) Transcript_110279:107-952(+)
MTVFTVSSAQPSGQQQQQYSEDELRALRRCRRCHQIYSIVDENATECRYHPGTYISSTTRFGNLGWSCCKQSRARGSSAEPPGCKVSHAHREDRTFRAAIESFPRQPTDAPRAGEASPPMPHAKELDAGKGEPTPISLAAEGQGTYVMHTVTKLDTLMGIALRYDSKPERILKFNNLYNEQAIHERGFLFIPDGNPAGSIVMAPAAPPDLRDGKMEQFCARANCRREVARFYMEDNDWDLDEAMAAWKADLDWNNEQDSRNQLVAQPVRVRRSKARRCCVF